MRILEAGWIYSAIDRQGLSAASPLLNLGSSTREFREVKKPHIHNLVFAPLERDGYKITHADLKSAPGVDLVGDIYDPEYRAKLKAGKYKSVLVSNILEHVIDPEKFAEACEDIVGVGGLIFVTGPDQYPYHADPIDTMYRPDANELAKIFTRSELVEGQAVTDGGPLADLRIGGLRAMAMMPVKAIWRLARYPLAPEIAKTEWARLRWYGRPYVITCAVYRVVRG